MRLLLVLTCLVVQSDAELCASSNAVTARIDFSSTTNPAVAMEWTDANEQVHTSGPSGAVSGLIPYLATDTTGGAFPAGSVRWRNLGVDGGLPFDLVVSVSVEPSYYSSGIAVEYWNPQSCLLYTSPSPRD